AGVITVKKLTCFFLSLLLLTGVFACASSTPKSEDDPGISRQDTIEAREDARQQQDQKLE
ncbi:MAG: hypothetical protein ACQEP7_05835, partial [bacterium]